MKKDFSSFAKKVSRNDLNWFYLISLSLVVLLVI